MEGWQIPLPKCACGNKIGFCFAKEEDYFMPSYGTFILELKEGVNDARLEQLGTTIAEKEIVLANKEKLDLEELEALWTEPLEAVFPTKLKEAEKEKPHDIISDKKVAIARKVAVVKPRVFIPAFPGTNSEYDSAKVFEDAGAISKIGVFTNLTAKNIEESIALFEREIKQVQIIMIPGGFSAGDEPDGSGKFIATVFRNPKIKEAVHKHLYEKDGLMLGICNGFQALVKLGLLPYGEILDMKEDMPTLAFNKIGRHQARLVHTKVTSKLSPWFSKANLGEIHLVPISHGEGRFVANEKTLKEMETAGQIATQYVDLEGNASYHIDFCPNSSTWAIEGITSKDGRILGKMGHSERINQGIVKNVNGNMNQLLFESGVEYYR